MTTPITAYTSPPTDHFFETEDGKKSFIPAPQYPDYVSISDAFGGGLITIVSRSLNGENHTGVGVPYDEFARMIAEIITNAPVEVIKMVNDRLDEKGNLRRDA